MTAPWHANVESRKTVGDAYEVEFADSIRCHCGGAFQFIGDGFAGCPDFTCDNCGQLVEVKGSPQAERTGNIAVSAIPWSHYPNDMLLVTKIKGRWIGEYKGRIGSVSEVYMPTHHSTDKKFHNTRFRLIPWKTFRTLSSLGYQPRRRVK